ncbi:MAG: hypothetical protein HY076_02490 [Candidatus Eisenbacteria bacterium]|uniref:AMP-activated protein kinase glycogen-binding domain-containing protein n=1 Tax=Eiseniibacteriota bacterium TaxID=2212470 RepID=A0A9D6QLX0_UNCEI|nr:hypothetical protein [Candidatus Eisenbacteria bacterium]MBI3539123.1 hypothetical protein [Candidatus Eisenbacteria bacterium]
MSRVIASCLALLSFCALAPPAPAARAATAPDSERIAAITGAETRASETSPFAPPATPAIPALRGGATLAASIASGPGRAAFGSIGRGTLALGGARGPAFELGLAGIAERTSEDVVRTGVRTQGRLRWGDADRSLWIGTALERMPVEGPASPPLLGLGISARRGSFDVAGSVERTMQPVRWTEEPFVRVDTLVERITTERDGAAPATAARLDMRWHGGRWSSETVAGLTLTRGVTRRWMQTAVSAALSPLLAIEATMGDPPPRWLALDAAPAHRAGLGLRLTPSLPGVERPAAPGHERLDWTVVRATGGRFTFRAHAPGVRRIELAGDWTEWNAVEMRWVTATRWELDVTLPPGVHELNLRCDGGPWSPPPGMPVRVDGFNGAVGVLVVR